MSSSHRRTSWRCSSIVSQCRSHVAPGATSSRIGSRPRSSNSTILIVEHCQEKAEDKGRRLCLQKLLSERLRRVESQDSKRGQDARERGDNEEHECDPDVGCGVANRDGSQKARDEGRSWIGQCGTDS